MNGSSLPPNAGVSTQAGGRVRAILTPKAAAAPAAPGAKPAAPAATPAPGNSLRSTTTLGGDSTK